MIVPVYGSFLMRKKSNLFHICHLLSKCLILLNFMILSERITA